MKRVFMAITMATLGAGLLLSGPAAAVDEPAGYRMDGYRSPTPAGLAGATTVDTATARALIDSGQAIPINVMKLDRSTLPGGPWIMAKPFRQIPGSVWLPNVGLGDPGPELTGWFGRHLDRLTGGDRGRGVLFYCLADCWMSWNAAKRALSLGYARVYWYPLGADGWAETGLPTEEGHPLPFD